MNKSSLAIVGLITISLAILGVIGFGSLENLDPAWGALGVCLGAIGGILAPQPS